MCVLDHRLRRTVTVIVSVVVLSAGLADAQEAGNFSGSLTHERDRSAELALQQAKSDLASGDIGGGVRHLQRVLDAEQDSLVLLNGTFRSAWDVADNWLNELSTGERPTYQRMFAQPAAEELAISIESGSAARLSRVARRYRLTSAGQQACVTLALSAVDRGRVEEANGWMRLIDGDMTDGPSRRIVERLSMLVAPPVDIVAAPSVADWSPVVAWHTETPLSNEARAEFALSLSELDAQNIVPLLTAEPLVHDGRVFARQLARLVAVEASTGEVLWHRDIDSLIGRLTRAGNPQDRMWKPTALIFFLERLVRSSLLDRLSTDGRRLFAIVAGPHDDPRTNAFVVENLLAAFSVDDGRLLWTAGSFGGKPPLATVEPALLAPDPELSDVFFVSTPQPVGAWGMVLGQRQGMVELLALDLSDGRLSWSVPLGRLVRTLEEDKSRQGTAGRIVVVDGRAYCATAAGALGCVDLLSRRLLWSARYSRDDISDPVSLDESHPESRKLLMHRRLPTRDAWQEVFLHVSADRVLLASPDADRLFAYDARDGREQWSQPRGDGLLVVGPVDDRLIVVGSESATALDVVDGQKLWTSPIARPGGQGVLDGANYVLPSLAGGLQRLDLSEGRVTSLAPPEHGDVTVVVNGITFPVTFGPPRRLRHVEPRNLVAFSGGVLAQTFDELSVLTESLSAPRDDQRELRPVDERASATWALVDRARIAVAHVSPTWAAADAALRRAEQLIPGMQSPQMRVSALIGELADSLRLDDRSRARLTLRRLLRQTLSDVYLTDENSHRTVRLDRWLSGGLTDAVSSTAEERLRVASMMSALLADSPLPSDVPPDGTRANDEDSSHDHRWHELLGLQRWGTAAPRITQVDSPPRMESLNTVPLTVTGDSSWEWVTVEVDRPGRNVYFDRADHDGPVVVALPASPNSPRMMTEFLHAWANGPLLCLRIGTELFGFRIDEPDGDLPNTIAWPARENSASLIEERAMNVGDLQDLSSSPLPLWDDSQPGLFDLFGRPFVQVGPVTASCVCHWDRGRLIALDPWTGDELWSRFALPLGTLCVGDGEHLALLGPDMSTVEVLRSRDGQTVHTWDWQTADVAADDILSQFVDVQGTLALQHSLPQQGDLRDRIELLPNAGRVDVSVSVVDLSTGRTLWTRVVPPSTWTVSVDAQHVAVIDPPGTLTLLDWRTGREVVTHAVSLPAQITAVEVITHAERACVVVSELPDDAEVFGTQQVHGSHRRPLVNGWMHALERSTGEHLWDSRLENVGLPLDQPRHVPLIVASDVRQSAKRQTADGVLRCYDIRNGQLVYEYTRPTQIYHTLRTDGSQRRIELQLHNQIVTFDYGAEE